MVRKRRRENWKMESNDRGWRGSIFRPSWNSRHVYNVARSKWDGCAFKESAYDGKVSRRVAYVPWFPSIYALYIRVCVCVCMQRDARRRKNARCVTGTKVCSRKRAPLSLPEYISVTAYRVCMKRFKYLNSFVRQIFFVARNSATSYCCSPRRIVGNL